MNQTQQSKMIEQRAIRGESKMKILSNSWMAAVQQVDTRTSRQAQGRF